MPLIIQPMVENAIQHGIEEQQGAYRVTIDVKELDTGALIIVADDGKGLTAEEIHQLMARLENESPLKDQEELVFGTFIIASKMLMVN